MDKIIADIERQLEFLVNADQSPYIKEHIKELRRIRKELINYNCESCKELKEVFFKKHDSLIDTSNEFMMFINANNLISEYYNRDNCVYKNAEGNCWAIKEKCNKDNINCDYRI